MKSAQIKGYGSTSDVIEIDQNTPAPNDPTDGKVLVKVKAAGVNPTDWKISEGYMQQIMPLEFPGHSSDGTFQVSSKRLELEFPTSNKVTRHMDGASVSLEDQEHLQKWHWQVQTMLRGSQ